MQRATYIFNIALSVCADAPLQPPPKLSTPFRSYVLDKQQDTYTNRVPWICGSCITRAQLQLNYRARVHASMDRLRSAAPILSSHRCRRRWLSKLIRSWPAKSGIRIDFSTMAYYSGWPASCDAIWAPRVSGRSYNRDEKKIRRGKGGGRQTEQRGWIPYLSSSSALYYRSVVLRAIHCSCFYLTRAGVGNAHPSISILIPIPIPIAVRSVT